MDWADFFDKTREAAGADSFAKLAPKIGVTDGAISHYRTGKRVPQVWVVAECLKLQGHPQPEKAAITIMKSEAQTSPERTFWKRLAATATLLLAVMVLNAAPAPAQAVSAAYSAGPDVHYAKYGMQPNSSGTPPACGCPTAFAAAHGLTSLMTEISPPPPPFLPRFVTLGHPPRQAPACPHRPTAGARHAPNCRVARRWSRWRSVRSHLRWR